MVRLYAPLSYQLATEEQKSGICNGCGTQKKWLGLFGFNVPDKLWGLRVTEACNIHDWMYEEGGNEMDRELADEWFLENMKLLINEGRWNFLRRLRMKDAIGYYEGVRIIGKYCFNYKGEDYEINV